MSRSWAHEMGVCLEANLSDPHEQILGAPQSPAHTATRSKHLFLLISAHTAWSRSVQTTEL